MLPWLLVFGYMVAMAVYSFTFGRYAANAPRPEGSRDRAVAIVVVFLGVNLRGVRTSSLTEDLVVLVKLLVLAGIAVVGLAQFDTARLAPLADRGVTGLFLGTATVFFAYEGFELSSAATAMTCTTKRTLPRALPVGADRRRGVHHGHARRADARRRSCAHCAEGGGVRRGR
ncbi:MAG: amino acid permease [Acidimicrobiia bacterium]